MQTVANSQLSMNLFGGLSTNVARVFENKDIVAKGEVVGKSLVFQKRRDIAASLNLKGKVNAEELDNAILEQTDEAFRQIKARIAGMDASWTMVGGSSRFMSNGQEQMVVKLRKISRKQLITFEKIAKAYGISVDDVAEFIEAQRAKVEAQEHNTLDVPAEPHHEEDTTETVR